MALRSAGILMYRSGRAGLEVLLVHPGGPFFAGKDAGVWGIPKGEYAAPEEPLACARREFAEEIGRELGPGPVIALGEIRQRAGKVVTAWAFEGDLDADRIASNTFSMEWPPRSGRQEEFPEVDRAGWFGLAEAHEKILPAQRPLLARLAEALAAGAPPGLGDPGPTGSPPAGSDAVAGVPRPAMRATPARGPANEEDTMADEDEQHGGAVGDTQEVHDTIHPRDLPPGHPGREAAEEALAEAEARAGASDE